jgi:hypothetical protein
VPERRVALQQVEEIVEQPDEAEPELLMGPIPLAVPVGVRDENQVRGRQRRILLDQILLRCAQETPFHQAH